MENSKGGVGVAIKDVKALEYEFDILGIRVFTTKEAYDIDIDTCKKMRINIGNLDSIQLIEFGGEYMTEEEMNGDVEVEDASEDLALQSQVKTYFGLLDEASPLYQRKKKEKVDEYSSSFYTYLPNEWLKPFAEYHFKNFEGNVGIYDEYSPAQLNIVKGYFRSRSRMIFAQSNTSPILVAKPAKTQKLIKLMGNATDWEYNGTVDTGYRGNGHCTLGHALRYEHHAYSKSLNTGIIFGQTCMSDFFEVDKAVIQEIVEAQNILLKEVKCMSFIVATNRYSEYSSSYSDVDTVLDWVKNVSGRSGAVVEHYLKFMVDFKRLRLPFTRSMVKKYEEWKKAYAEYMKMPKSFKTFFESEKYIDTQSRKDAMTVLEALSRNEINMKPAFWGYTILKYEIKEFYPFIRFFADNYRRLEVIARSVGTDSRVRMKIMDNLAKRFKYIYDNDGRRLATEEEIANNTRGIVEEGYLPAERQRLFLLVFSIIEPNPHFGKEIDVPDNIKYKVTVSVNKFMSLTDTMLKAFHYGSTKDFTQDYEFLQNPMLKPQERNVTRKMNPSPAKVSSYIREAKDKSLIVKKYDYVSDNLSHLTEKELAWFLRVSTYNLDTSKDKLFIENVYKRVLTRSGAEDYLTEASADAYVSVEDMMVALVRAKDLEEFNPNHFVFKVIETIERTKKRSDKQIEIIKKAYNELD